MYQRKSIPTYHNHYYFLKTISTSKCNYGQCFFLKKKESMFSELRIFLVIFNVEKLDLQLVDVLYSRQD